MKIKENIKESTLQQINDIFGCYECYYIFKTDCFIREYLSSAQNINSYIRGNKYYSAKKNIIKMEDIAIILLLKENQQKKTKIL
jgi:hypothetical protein